MYESSIRFFIPLIAEKFQGETYMKSLFVGNLPWSATEDELKAKFAEHGTVLSCRIVTDKFSGKSRGFGFVDMEDADAQKAIEALNGFKMGEREIAVNEARPKADRSDNRRNRSYSSF
jgi:RNA recognition motif-containing protein